MEEEAEQVVVVVPYLMCKKELLGRQVGAAFHLPGFNTKRYNTTSKTFMHWDEATMGPMLDNPKHLKWDSRKEALGHWQTWRETM